MRTPRIFSPGPLAIGEEKALSPEASHYLVQVLRLKAGANLRLFNGEGQEFLANLIAPNKRQALVSVTQLLDQQTESPLKIHLGQALSRTARMDYAIQKAVEMGVHTITPLQTEFTSVKTDKTRQEKRLQHWQGVTVSACEQSGRVNVPTISSLQPLSTWLKQCQAPLRLVFDVSAATTLAEIKEKPAEVAVLIGPEGGLSQQELDQAKAAGFTAVRFGPRLLRTETAPVAALSVLQFLWGDLAS